MQLDQVGKNNSKKGSFRNPCFHAFMSYLKNGLETKNHPRVFWRYSRKNPVPNLLNNTPSLFVCRVSRTSYRVPSTSCRTDPPGRIGLRPRFAASRGGWVVSDWWGGFASYELCRDPGSLGCIII